MGGGSGVISCASISPAPYGSRSRSKSTRRREDARHTIVGDSSISSIGDDKHLPPVGLQNVGNTCYANAALQCILSTALSHALLDPKSTHIFRRYSSNPGLLALGSGSVDSDENDSEDDPDPEQDGGNAAASEWDSRRSARRRARETRRKNREKILKHEKCQWLTGELTDITRIYTASHLNNLRDQNGWQSVFHLFSVTNDHRVVDPGGITRHVNKLSPCLRPYQQEDAHEFLRTLLSTLTLDGHNKKLSSLFDGLLESAVTCQTCHRASITRDRYMDLSLDIQGDVQDLTGALRNFTQTELLDSNNKVVCARCRTKRVVSKGLRLATAPTVLVCHLKRFAFDIYGRTRRLSKSIDYPLSLEIGEFMSKANQSKPPPYELVGVLVHAGARCESGHYIAFIKSAERWYMANDEVVEEVPIETVLAQQAYMLFYEVEGMRRRHGYRGFRKYHRACDVETCAPTEPCSASEKNSTSSTEGVDPEPSKSQENMTTPSKVTSLMDGMLNFCGSVETVRDAFCDSDRKEKKKNKSRRDDPSSSLHRSSHHSSKKKSRSRKKDQIFRRASERTYRSSSERNRHRHSYNDHQKEYFTSDCDISVLSTDSRMIRSVSSNNIFEKQEEALTCYENESYASRSPRRKSSHRRGFDQSDRSMSPAIFRYGNIEEERKSDTAVTHHVTSSTRLLKSFSNESFASRSPLKTSRQRSRNLVDRSISPPNILGFGGDDLSRAESRRQRKFSSTPRSRRILENSENMDMVSPLPRRNLATTMPYMNQLSQDNSNDSSKKLPPLPPK